MHQDSLREIDPAQDLRQAMYEQEKALTEVKAASEGTDSSDVERYEEDERQVTDLPQGPQAYEQRLRFAGGGQMVLVALPVNLIKLILAGLFNESKESS